MNTAYQRERIKQAIERFNSLDQETKIKDFSWYAGYINIAAKDYPHFPCFHPNHYFNSKEPEAGELCNCKQYAYREDGYCQKVIEEEYNPIAYA